ncbi:MAG TPA: EF-hand domain-containing protein [Rhodanobacteraceae bacterium]
MYPSRPIGLGLAGAVALALCCGAPAALAQTTQSTQQFYQGTESTATYALPDSHGGTLTVHAGMPEHVHNYGPPPPFKSLDTNHDGRISEAEARAYPPLDSDFLFASGGAKTISRAQYEHWAKTQH